MTRILRTWERIRFEIVPEPDVAKAIIKETSDGPYAVVATGRNGKTMGFVERVFVGAVSRALLQELERTCLWMA